MNLEDITRFVEEITNLELSDRNLQMRRKVHSINEEMAERGLTNSTLTLDKFSEFFIEEFKERSNYISEQFLGVLSKVDLSDAENLKKVCLSRAMKLFKRQKKNMQTLYDEISQSVAKSLQSGIKNEIKQQMQERMDGHIEKLTKTLEFEYRVAIDTNGRSIISGTPTIYGIRIDVRKLWNNIKA